mmetsp:Transcript_80867/g.142640  ORF Transcript_80867/g.142640 Transcript_80867/m.142640 type:complete len:316 (-) Transcript_80867:246-1193(-)|eukprot:CAMPEP_0197659296 /NCGR_PEP_ID=MMETSP1338-20131121/47079_1 /TAXON_ID=43686 ORGANISM="Pelagodinium beii, Strain RCC1491" /NCGR_SAMPLE_ID=MMETSP1338 /ASSEMBLY_ACC=CAM_ASM_000754 /LENGTH=315 /DNA_ID=CAMNT_0043236159 /DNA_START=66 /DNA_END=1013 /DNA_ORIENTATION=+
MGQDTEAAAEVSEVHGLLERGEDQQRPAESQAELQSSGLQLRAAGKVGVVLSGLAAVCLVAVIFTKPAMLPNFDMLSQAGHSLISLEAAMALDASQCIDTQNWANGYYKCNENGYTGIGCVANGFNCEAYASNALCVAGKPVPGKDWAFGESLNYPELNCCACGGGSGSLSGSTSAAASPAAVTLPTTETTTTTTFKPPKPTTCSAYSACSGVSGNCCPNDNGINLACCESAMTCFDTPAWTNGYIKCANYGFTEEQGCTYGGVTCAGYVNQSFCADGKVLEGKEWTLGGRYNHPELNCCACGKSVEGNVDNAVW